MLTLANSGMSAIMLSVPHISRKLVQSMPYIKRDMEDTFLRISSQFKVVLVTGPRQVGKTTMMKKLMENSDI